MYSAEKCRNCLENTDVSQKMHLCGHPRDVSTYVEGNFLYLNAAGLYASGKPGSRSHAGNGRLSKSFIGSRLSVILNEPLSLNISPLIFLSSGLQSLKSSSAEGLFPLFNSLILVNRSVTVASP